MTLKMRKNHHFFDQSEFRKKSIKRLEHTKEVYCTRLDLKNYLESSKLGLKVVFLFKIQLKHILDFMKFSFLL